MKPQITIQDFGGLNSKDPTATAARLMKGSSWKKTRIVVIIPADYDRIGEKNGEIHHYHGIASKVYLTHWNLIFPPNQQVVKILAQGMEVGEAYTNAVQAVLAHPELSQWEYLLTLEHDNTPPQDGLLRLIQTMETHRKFACVGGLYFTKGVGGVAQIWGDPDDPFQNFRPRVPDPAGGLVECCGTGMGFNLWRLAMFKDDRLRKPWFKTLTGIEGKGIGTQDLYFWGDARKFGYRCAVDCSVNVGHYDAESDTVW